MFLIKTSPVHLDRKPIEVSLCHGKDVLRKVSLCHGKDVQYGHSHGVSDQKCPFLIRKNGFVVQFCTNVGAVHM